MYFNEDDEAHGEDLLEGYQAECERLEKKLKEYKMADREWDTLRDFIQSRSVGSDAGFHYGDIAIKKIVERENIITSLRKELNELRLFRQRLSEILKKHESGEENVMCYYF